MRVSDALCDHQRAGNNYFPHVWVGSDELAEELGMDEANVRRALRKLRQLGLLSVELGGGRLPATKNHKGKANTYRLGPACGRQIKGVAGDPLKPSETGSAVTPYPAASELHTGSAVTPHPSGVLRTPPGDRGKRTVALTGDPPPIQLSPEAITPHRFRDRVFRALSRGSG